MFTFQRKQSTFFIPRTIDRPTSGAAYATTLSYNSAERDWEKAFTTRVPNVPVDSVEVRRYSGIEDGIMAAYISFLTFSIHTASRHFKFPQKYIAKISLDEDNIANNC